MKILVWAGADIYRSDPVASTYLHSNLLQQIDTNSIDLRVFTYISQQSFPRGNLLGLNSILQCSPLRTLYVIPYPNIKYIRYAAICCIFMLYILCLIIRQGIKPINVFCYNQNSPFFAASILLASLKLPIYTNVLFADGPSRPWKLCHSYHFLSYATFLRFSRYESKSFFINLPPYDIPNKVDINPYLIDLSKKEGKRSILFSGSLNAWSGIVEFCSEADSLGFFLSCHLFITTLESSIPDTLLHLASRGDITILKNLNLSEIDSLSRNVDYFLITRNKFAEHSDVNFPSKLLRYLPYYKPILSPTLPSYPPIYGNMLIYYSGVTDIPTILDSPGFEKRARHCRLQQMKYCSTVTWKSETDKLIRNLCLK